MRKIIFIKILFFIYNIGLIAQVPQNICDSLQHVLDIYQEGYTIPGISAAVNIHNIGIWTGTSGESFANMPLTQDMLMGIGSNTKLFTATLMLKLLEHGIVSLDDSLHNWLPNFNNIDSTITIKQLLRHNSGLAEFWTPAYVNVIFSNPDSVWSPEDVLNFVGPPLFTPGTGISYSNANFTLAGMIIETATGQEYHALVRDSILNPLNLNNTFLEGFETVPGISAHPWHLGEDVYLVPRTAVSTAAFAGGCIKSIPEDMVKWYDQLFNQNFLSANSFMELTDFINISGSSVNGVGCGIFRMNVDSKTYYVHSGNIRGYSSYMIYDTMDKHSISVLRNDTFVDCENIAVALAKALNVLVTSLNEKMIYFVTENFKLFQNFPNPFNAETKITFFLTANSIISIQIYNLQGRLVEVLIDHKYFRKGNHSVKLKSDFYSSGVYYYRLIVNMNHPTTKKMCLIK